MSSPHSPFTCRKLETVNATDTKDKELQALLTTDPTLLSSPHSPFTRRSLEADAKDKEMQALQNNPPS